MFSQQCLSRNCLCAVHLLHDPLQMGVLTSTSPPSPPCLAAIQPSSSYIVVTCDFLGRGGDNYTDLAAATTVLQAGRVLADVVGDYIALNSPLHPPPGGAGRIYVGPASEARAPQACRPDASVGGGKYTSKSPLRCKSRW